ncbi:MAG: hypothetical protein K0S01_2941 [Herbinix sp.]|jgi:hypothetical protein|nr:hypothetical protein [Herbinix sp.]
MKEDQQIPMLRRDILDILKAIKLLDLLQKKDILITIIDLKTKSDD